GTLEEFRSGLRVRSFLLFGRIFIERLLYHRVEFAGDLARVLLVCYRNCPPDQLLPAWIAHIDSQRAFGIAVRNPAAAPAAPSGRIALGLGAIGRPERVADAEIGLAGGLGEPLLGQPFADGGFQVFADNVVIQRRILAVELAFL